MTKQIKNVVRDRMVRPEDVKAAARRGTVRVRVLGQSVGEAGGVWHRGDVFELGAGRRAALGDLVEDMP